MSEELLRLKSIGAQKIYEDTHIPVLHVKAILQHNFDSLQRVQFLGFISILEREYSLELTSTKASGVAYFDDKDAEKLDENLFVAPTKKINLNTVYSVIAIVIFITIMVYKLGSFGESEVKEQIIDNKLIYKVQETLKPVLKVKELNTTSEVNSTQVVVEISEPVEVIPKSFKIVTKSKVWIGYINVKTNQKKQKTFRGELDLDPQKKWLLLFGHSHITMYINGEKVNMNIRNNMRYLYEDNSLKAISLSEFKKLNRGRKW